MIHLSAKAIEGKSFTALDPKIQYVCIGYGETGTSLIFGATWDSVNNRSKIQSFKVSEVTFIGKLDP